MYSCSDLVGLIYNEMLKDTKRFISNASIDEGANMTH